jgi:uncharacterized protein (TIGR02246 family)
MRMLVIGGALAALVVSLAACGGSGETSSEADVQRRSDLYEIGQLERSWHQATSKKDIDLFMSLWAPNATMTVGPGQIYKGRDQIRRYFLAAPTFQPENHWISETPAYKIRVTVNGDRGTLYFECHYADVATKKLMQVTGADAQVARIDGKWLITNNVGASPTLTP